MNKQPDYIKAHLEIEPIPHVELYRRAMISLEEFRERYALSSLTE